MPKTERQSPRRKKTVRTKNRKIMDMLIYAFIILVVVTSYRPVRDYFNSKLLDYSYLQYSVLEDKINTSALLIMTEQVVASSTGGQVYPTLQEGERAASGEAVAYITQGSGSKIILNAPFAGVVSYQVDGLESSLLPGCWDHLLLSDVLAELEKAKQAAAKNNKNSSKQDTKAAASSASAVAGNAVKVIDNLKDVYVYMELPQRETWPAMEAGDSFSLDFSNGVRESASIVQVKDVEEKRQVLLLLSVAKDLALGERLQDCGFVVDSQKGYIVPVSAICYDKNNETGIKIIKKNLVQWQAIEIVSQIGKSVVIKAKEGSVNVSTLVITNPGRAKEGQRVYF